MFGGGKGGGRPLASQPSILHALRVQTSAYGQAMPVVIGTNRVPGKLIWYGDFTAIAHTSTTAVGGKGGGGGGVTTTTTYTYTAACMIALCEGPISGLRSVWDTKGKLNLLTTSEVYTVSGGGGSYSTTHSANFYDSDGVSRADSYSVPVNDYGGGATTLTGTQKTPMTRVVGAPAAGQYSVSAGVFTFAAADAGKQVTINYSYSVPDGNSNGQPLSKLNVTLFPGARPESPWGYLTSAHPGEDLGYSGIAKVCNSAFDLGESGTLPNYNWEVASFGRFGGDTVDASPAYSVSQILTNVFWGAQWAAGAVGDITQFDNFCVANGLFISPVLDAQRSAKDWVDLICAAMNTAALWSEGKLKFIPYGDTSAVGNGAQYTPNTAPVYDLTDADYQPGDGEDPVVINRISPDEAKNSVRVQYTNRATGYNPDAVQELDDAAIETYGLKEMNPLDYSSFITTQAVASASANMALKRSVYIRNTYNFNLGMQYSLLEPMDMVTLTDSVLGLAAVPVRIKEISEDPSKDRMKVVAEEFPWGTATPTQYPKQGAGSYSPQADADPGSVNTPIIFEATNRLSEQAGYEIWMAVSGASADWGGCSIYVSDDGTTYRRVGDPINGGARMGTLTSTLASHADPDTADTLAVDLTTSRGVLASGTNSDRDSFRTLCYVDGELCSYKTATLTAANKYNITDLRRGVYGSTIAAHSSGTKFARLDAAIAVLGFGPEDIGKTIHLKFTSFNSRGLNEQSLANAVDYTYTITGAFKGAIDRNTNGIIGFVDPTGSNVLKIGSLAPQFNGALVYSNTPTSIQWSTVSMVLNRTDATNTTVADKNINSTGLPNLTTYSFGPYYDELNAYFDLLAGGEAGTPAVCHTVKTSAKAAAIARQDRSPMATTLWVTAATLAGGGGSGGGGGGGDGSCLNGTMLVCTRERGVVQIRTVKIGEHLLTRTGNWTRVKAVKVMACETFIRFEAGAGRAVEATATHPMTVLDDGQEEVMRRAARCSVADALLTNTGIAFPTSIGVVKRPGGEKVSVTCEPDHTFMAGEAAVWCQMHNMQIPS